MTKKIEENIKQPRYNSRVRRMLRNALPHFMKLDDMRAILGAWEKANVEAELKKMNVRYAYCGRKFQKGLPPTRGYYLSTKQIRPLVFV